MKKKQPKKQKPVANRVGWIMNLKVEADNEKSIREEAEILDRDFTWVMNQRMRDSYKKTKQLTK